MKEVAFTDAKAQLSRLVDDARNGEPSVIARHGRKEAVVVSFDEWARMTARPALWDLLTQAPVAGAEISRNPSPARRHDV